MKPLDNKNRNLSLFKFFEQLQLEYIVAELRKKIYPSDKDKNYYQKVMDNKKTKIQDIGIRNSLPSIFSTDLKVKNSLYLKVYKEVGFPLFLYRDEAHKLECESLDLRHYYKEGKEVKVTINGEPKIGTVETVNLKAKLVEVKFSPSNIEVYPIDIVNRIL